MVLHVEKIALVNAPMVVDHIALDVVEIAKVRVVERVADTVMVEPVLGSKEGLRLCHKHRVDVEQVVTLYVEHLVRALNQLKHIKQQILLSYGLRQRRLVEVSN